MIAARRRAWPTAAALLIGATTGCTSGAAATGSAGASTSAPPSVATAAPASASASAATSTAGFVAALETLEGAIRTKYSHRDRLRLDWTKIFEDARAEASRPISREEFVGVVLKVLGRAQDPHIAVIDGSRTLPTDTRPLVKNVDVERLKQRVKDWKFPGKCVQTGVVDGFAYVLLNGFEKGRCDRVVQDFESVWPELEKSAGLILDLRGNQGGNELFGQAIASRFVDAPTPYVTVEPYDVSYPGGFAPPVKHVLQPQQPADGTPRKPRWAKPVAVLIGALDMSSAELFILMMRAAGATLVGATTRGASANPQPTQIGEGLTVMLPSWRARSMDGSPLEGIGIKPDVPVEVGPDGFASTDPVIDAAVAALRKKLGK